MAQQPNIELAPADRPQSVLEPDPSRRHGPARPGLITTPAEMPHGPGYGTPGPDTGWAYRIIHEAELPQRTPLLEKVVVALMSARSAHYGRAPVPADLDVALVLLGLGSVTSDELDARRSRWLKAASHERSPGRTAVAEAGETLQLVADEVAARLSR